jgi:hypothetical protein
MAFIDDKHGWDAAKAALLDAIAGSGRLMLDAAAERLAPLSPPALERALERRREILLTELEGVEALPPNEAQIDAEILELRDRVATLQAAENAVIFFLSRPDRAQMMDAVADSVPSTLSPDTRAALLDVLRRVADRIVEGDEQRAEIASCIADRLLDRIERRALGRQQLASITVGRAAQARRRRPAASQRRGLR